MMYAIVNRADQSDVLSVHKTAAEADVQLWEKYHLDCIVVPVDAPTILDARLALEAMHSL